MTKLKSCPFCGGEAHMQTSKRWPDGADAAVDGYTVVCQNLDCILGGDDEWWTDTEAEAVEAWNTRADDYRAAADYWRRMFEETVRERTSERTCTLPETRVDNGCIEYNGVTEWRKCSACGEEVLAYPAHHCPNCGARVEGETEWQS